MATAFIRRHRFWLILSAAAACIALALVALPEVLRRVAVSKLGAATGREVAIEDIDLNLFTGRLAVKAFALADRDGSRPLARADRIEARVRLLPLLNGRLEIESATLAGPTLRIVRSGPSELNVSDLLRRAPAGETAPGIHAVIDRLTLVDGTLIFEDRVLDPSREWKAEHLSLEVHQIATRQTTDAGSGSAAFTVAGAEIALTAEPLLVTPAEARLVLTIRGLAVGPFFAYAPPSVPARLDHGRLDATVTVQYGAEAGIRADLDATVDEVVVLRQGQSPPFVIVPTVTVAARDLALRDGRLTAGRAELTGDPTVLDTSASTPQRFDIQGMRLLLTDVTWPGGEPAGVELTAGLPEGGTLDAHGTFDPRSLAASLDIALGNVDLSLLRPYLPPDAPVTLAGGRLDATLELRHADSAGLRVTGDGTVEALMTLRRGQEEPFLSVPRLEFAVEELLLQAGQVMAERVRLAGEPSIVDASLSPAQRFDLEAVRVVVENAALPSGGPARVALAATLPERGRVSAQGSIDPAPLSADLDLALDEVDLELLLPYLPPDAEVSLERGRLTAKLRLRHSEESGTRVDGDGTVGRLRVLRRGQSRPFISVPSLAFAASNLAQDGGVVSAEQVAMSGEATIVDGSLSPPQSFEFRSMRLSLADAAWPSGGPARVELVAVGADGGSVEARGTVDPAPLSADLELGLQEVDLTRFRPYLPADLRESLASGRLSATARLRHAGTGGTRIDGGGTVEQLAIPRLGSRPFVSVPALEVGVTSLRLENGAVSAERLALSGQPTIVDGTVSPPQRYEFTSLDLVMEDAGWPTGGPARIELAGALADGSRIEARGAVDPAPLTADLELGLQEVDLARLSAYLPADGPVSLGSGRVTATLRLLHGEDGVTRVMGDGSVSQLALLRRGQSEPLVAIERLALALRDVTMEEGALAAGRIEAEGRPTIVDGSVSPARHFTVESFRLAVEEATWPAAKPAGVQLTLDLPQGGSLSADGAVALASRAAELRIVASDLHLGPYQPYLPVDGRLAGTLDADLAVSGSFAREPQISVRGTARLGGLELGPAERPLVTVKNARAIGVDIDWPERVEVERLLLEEPSALIEREARGGFPLREMLAPRAPEPSRSPPRVAKASAPADGAGPDRRADEAPPARRTAIAIGQVAIEDGHARFVDRTTSPFYSEEISKLQLTIDGLSSEPDHRARITAQGVVGAGGAIDLRGEVDPFGDDVFLDLEGEIRDFAIPRINPYARRLLDWIARTGRLTTKVHYRVVGDRLEATNDIVVQRLDVVRAGRGLKVERRIGVPLGLAVALLKDSRGEIRLSVPVTGRLGSPEFSFGDALVTALQNVVVKTITAPLQLIGTVFRRGEKIEEIKIDPIRFDPGSAVVSPQLERQLQQVADFLRASPFVRLELEPVVSEADLRLLRTREVTARIQRREREQKLGGFPAASVDLFRSVFPDRPVPKTVEEVVAILRDREPLPEEAARKLAARRLQVTRETLIRAAGIEAERLLAADSPAPIGSPGAGRVEFEIRPAG